MALHAPVPGDTTARLALDANGLAALKLQAKGSPEQALKAAASQFEALFVQMLLKSMRDALPQDGLMSSDATKSYTGMLDSQLAQHLGKRGIGIADVLVKQLSRGLPNTGDKAGAPATPAVEPGARPADAAGVGAALRARSAAASAAAYARANASASTSAAASATSTASATATGPAGAADAARNASPAATAPPSGIAANVRAFVDKLQPYAEAIGRTAGVPGAFLLAQAGLETGWGRAQPRAADGTPSHNLFGIKAGKSWTGPTVEAVTTEYVDGRAVTTKEKFRAYASYGEALQDFVKLVGANPRYAGVVASASDAGAYAKGLQKAGYATDPHYADKLTAAIRTVARYTGGTQAAPAQVLAGDAVKRA